METFHENILVSVSEYEIIRRSKMPEVKYVWESHGITAYGLEALPF